MNMLRSILLSSLLMGFVATASAANANLGNVDGQVAFGQTYTTQGAFVDNYSFTATLSSFSAFLTTLNFTPFTGVQGLSAKLYEGNVTDLTGLTPVFTSVLEVLPNGSNNATISQKTLAAGNYTLSVSGTAIGTTFSFYNGVLNITPIPEPATGGLLLVGLSMMGLIVRKRIL